MINCIRVIPGSNNVEPLLGVTATADYQDATIKWPLLTEEIKVNNNFEDAWPQVGWSVKQSTTLDGELKDPASTDDLSSWSQVNALQAGVSIAGKINGTDYVYATQVYVEVDYTPITPTFLLIRFFLLYTWLNIVLKFIRLAVTKRRAPHLHRSTAVIKYNNT